MKRNLLCGGKMWRKRIFIRPFLIFMILCAVGTFRPRQLLAQNNQRVTLEMKGATVEQMIVLIENSTPFGFAYRAGDLPSGPARNYAFQDSEIGHVMNDLLKESGLTWTRSGYIITIFREPAKAQPSEGICRGRVSDHAGVALPGVHVRITGTDTGTITDIAGEFSLKVPHNSSLEFSFLGKETQEVLYSGQQNIEVNLNDSLLDIDQVVVTGIFNKARESYTGAATTITAAELRAFGNRSLLSTIRNIDPSFNVLDDIDFGSDPNRLPDITIRGRSSMGVDLKELQMENTTQSTANLPLFIVDGFEVSLWRVQDMDQGQVNTITILKDASATALYGSRGANGIVVITTVLPEPGRLRFTYKGGVNIEVPDLSSYDLMNAREKLEYEMAANIYYNVSPQANQHYLELYSERYANMIRGVDTFWLKYPTRTGVGQRHNVRIEGGEGSFTYAGTIGYNRITGTMKGSNRQNTTGGLFFQYNKGRFVFRNDLSLVFNKSTESPYGNFSDYTYLNPYESPYEEDGSMKKMLVDVTIAGIYRRIQVANPLYNATLPTKNTSKYNQLNNNFSVEYKIMPELVLRGALSIIMQDGQSDKYLSANHTSFENLTGEEFNMRGSYTYGTSTGFSYEGDVTLNFNKAFNKHLIYAGLNYNFADIKDDSKTFVAAGLAALNMDNIGLAMGYAKGLDSKPRSTENHSRRLGGTINVNYTYDQRYFADFSGKIEGSSKFGADDKVAPFWSAGMGWNLHQESFFSKGNAINTLRLRFSYGTSGSQNFSPYQAMTTYRYFDQLNYRYRNGAYMLALGNSDLSWQKTSQWNAGLETQMFNGRVRLNFDVYRKMTNDLLSDINLPISAGFRSYKANVGKVSNRGVEVTANVFVIRDTTREITWSVGGSLAHNKNKILRISNSLEFLNEQLLTESGSNPSFLYQEGQSMNTIFAVPSLGIDPASGREIYIKRDGTKTFTWDAADKAPCGVAEPKVWGNAHTSFRFKKLTLNASFSYRLGGDVYNQTLVDKVEYVDPWKNADRRVFKDRWREPGDHSFFKRVGDNSRTDASSRFVMRERTFQCRSVNVNYDFSRQWLLKNLGLEYLSLGVYLEDLFRISTIKQERGIIYPFARKYSFSLTARF